MIHIKSKVRTENDKSSVCLHTSRSCPGAGRGLEKAPSREVLQRTLQDKQGRSLTDLESRWGALQVRKTHSPCKGTDAMGKQGAFRETGVSYKSWKWA